MHTSSPQISILMAVYEPNLKWLKEQLDSLESQTYPNLKLYVCDDCSPTFSFDVLKDMVKHSIHSFPVIVERNEKNVGSTLTFERLTCEADGEYFAYCDQDDIWLPEKLNTLKNAIEQNDASLVCSDMYVIDGNGRKIANSILEIKKGLTFLTGKNLASKLLYGNCFTGCSMLIHSSVAKGALPFCPYMIHDYYLAIAAAVYGQVVSLPDKLINYRIHSNNQSIPLVGIETEQDYYEVRIEKVLLQYRWLKNRFVIDDALSDELCDRIHWLEARKAWFWGDKTSFQDIWKGRRFSIHTTVFELLKLYKNHLVLHGVIEHKQRGYHRMHRL